MPFTYVVNVYRDMSLSKGHLGSVGKASKIKFHLSYDKRHNFRCILYACSEGIPYGLGNEEHSYP